jgi:hypothetical protein
VIFLVVFLFDMLKSLYEKYILGKQDSEQATRTEAEDNPTEVKRAKTD